METPRSLLAALTRRGNPFAEKVTVVPSTPQAHAVLGRDDFFRAFRVDFSGWTEDLPSFNVVLARTPAPAEASRTDPVS